ncbi:TolC family protein [candidate division KSB1 bacterium]
MRKTILTPIFALIILFAGSGFAQVNEGRTLTLEESIAIALKESYSIKSAEQNLIASQKSLMSWKLGLRSQVDMKVTIPSYNRSVQLQFNPITQLDEYFKRETNQKSASFTINQPIVPTNTLLFLSGDLVKTSQFGLISKTDWGSNFGINLNQPLFTPNERKMQGEEIELGLEESEKNYTQTQQNIIFNVTSSFYMLYSSARRMSIAEEEVQQRENSYNLAMNKFKAGILAEVEALAQEVDLAEARSTYQQRLGDYRRQEDAFKLLIGLSLDERIQPVAQIDIKLVDVNETKAIDEAIKRRPDIRVAEIDIIQQENRLRREKATRQIKASINAFYGVDKNADYLKNVMKEFNESNRITFTVDVPIWDWGSHKASVDRVRANIKNAELNLENTRRQLITDIKDLVTQFNESKERLNILEKNVEVAQKQFDISLERFNNGDIDTEGLALAQTRLSTAKLSQLDAQISYLRALSNLKRSTYWDFEKDEPVFEIQVEK